MPFAQVRDLDVYYELRGRGPRVLMISGTGGDVRHHPLGGQALLEQHHEMLMYDQRGLGQTTKPDSPYSMGDYADDAAALMDAVSWKHAHVIGTSFGGMVAQHLAIRHPERVDRLVLACTSSGGAGGSSYDLLQLDGLPAEDRVARWLPLLDTRVDLSTDPPTLPASLVAIAPLLASLGQPTDDPAAAMGARRQLEARSAHDVWDDLPGITAPTLVIGGRHDGQAPPANSERLASRIPGAHLVLCDGGHVFMFQDPAAWPAIVEFLDERDEVADALELG
jgi:3-oxoadipate enol-lactonase